MKNETYITLRSTIKKLDKIQELEQPDNSKNYLIYEFTTNPFTNDEMEVLLTFKSIAQNDIKKSQVLVPWGDDSLFVREENKMFISHDLRLYLYLLIVFRFKERIDSFLNYFKYTPIFSLKLFKNSVIEMDFQIIHSVFTEIRCHIKPKGSQEVEIDLDAIRSILEMVKANYDFSKIENI